MGGGDPEVEAHAWRGPPFPPPGPEDHALGGQPCTPALCGSDRALPPPLPPGLALGLERFPGRCSFPLPASYQHIYTPSSPLSLPPSP